MIPLGSRLDRATQRVIGRLERGLEWAEVWGKPIALAGAGIGIAALVTCARSHAQDFPTRPDSTFTPGIAWTSDAIKACVRPLPPRPSRGEWLALKYAAMQRYGVSWHRRNEVQLDHRIPRCIAGSDDLRNLWPEAWSQASRKDVLEEAICHQVCSGAMTLRDGQAYFRSDEWMRDIDK